MRNNATQEFGYGSKYYDNAIETARYVKEQLGQPAGGLDLAGSSMGGGLATAAALKTGLHAEVFNPSWVHDNTVRDGPYDTTDYRAMAQEDIGNGQHLVDSHVVPHDLVTTTMEALTARPEPLNPVMMVSARLPSTGYNSPADIHGARHDLPDMHSPLRPDLAHGGWVGALDKAQTEQNNRLDAVNPDAPQALPPVPQPWYDPALNPLIMSTSPRTT